MHKSGPRSPLSLASASSRRACPIVTSRWAAQITRLEKSSPQSYYVVVVKSSGTGRAATGEFADDLVDVWSTQKVKRERSFDADRSVVIVVALENRQVAIKPGAVLRSRFGLHAERVERDLLPAFLPLAQENRYAEAISALLDKTNNWIAAQDTDTPYVAVQVAASKGPGAPSPLKTATAPGEAPASAPKESPLQPADTDRGMATAQPRHP